MPNFRLRQSLIETHVPTGPWRSPGHSAYCWAYQSFFDEVAISGGRDQLEFRLDLLSKSYGDPPLDLKRTGDALRIAAQKAGWGSRKLDANHGMGLAFHYDHGGFVSHVAEVVADGSNVKVEKVWSGIDAGPVLNLSGARNQVEGAVVDALSTAQLEITFADGAAEQNNFHDYGLLRINQAPEIECHFIQSDNSPSGLGEPPFVADVEQREVDVLAFARALAVGEGGGGTEEHGFASLRFGGSGEIQRFSTVEPRWQPSEEEWAGIKQRTETHDGEVAILGVDELQPAREVHGHGGGVAR